MNLLVIQLQDASIVSGRFAAPHSCCGLLLLPSTRYNIIKAWLFYRCTLLCTPNWLAQPASVWKKSKVRDAWMHPLGLFGRFCVLTMVVRFMHRKVLDNRTAATVHPLCWQNGGLYSPGLSVTNRFLVPVNAMPVRQQGVHTISNFLPRRSKDTRSVMLQPVLTASVRRSHPWQAALPMRRHTNQDNSTTETGVNH